MSYQLSDAAGGGIRITVQNIMSIIFNRRPTDIKVMDVPPSLLLDSYDLAAF